MSKIVCTIKECEMPAICRGWCEKHYMRFRRYGNPMFIKTLRGATTRCSYEGCEVGAPFRRGYCLKHSARLYRRGNLGLTKELHGRSGTKEYVLWLNIKDRTSNTNSPDYPYYGGRGVTLYKSWKNSFSAFYAGLVAAIGEHPGGSYSLDRIDNNGNYVPGNLRWATKLEQVLNRRPKTKKRNGGIT